MPAAKSYEEALSFSQILHSLLQLFAARMYTIGLRAIDLDCAVVKGDTIFGASRSRLQASMAMYGGH
jgi:hypothetical protein